MQRSAAWIAATLLTIGFVGNQPVPAGPGFLVVATQLGDPDRSSDDFTLRLPLRFPDNLNPRFYLFRPEVVALEPGVLGIESNPDEATDAEVYAAVNRAINSWKDAGAKISALLFSEDGAVSGVTPLIAGPTGVNIDTLNTITFQDPLVQPADGVIFEPVYVYFDADFNPETDPFQGRLLRTAGDIEPAVDPIDPEAENFLTDEDMRFLIANRRYKGGELVECDITFNSSIEYFVYPENQSDLLANGKTIQGILGTADVEALVTKAIGRAVGLGQSHLFNPATSPFYVVLGDTVNSEFLANPYTIRELTLDDVTGVSALYENESGGGIAGNIVDGRYLSALSQFNDETGGSIATTGDLRGDAFGAVPTTPVYVGQPLASGQAIDLDTVVDINPRYGITESIVGPIQLKAHTITGQRQRFARSVNTEGSVVDTNIDFAVSGLKSDYRIQGIPAGTWYALIAPRDETVSIGDDSAITGLNFFGSDPRVFPVEFFGGVSTAAPLPGDGQVSESSTTDNIIRGSFVEIRMQEELVTVSDPATGATTQVANTTGRFSIAIAQNAILTDTNFGFTVAQLVLNPGSVNPAQPERRLFFDNRSRGFGGAFAERYEKDENRDFVEADFVLRDKTGTAVGILTERIEVTSLPNVSVGTAFNPVTEKRAVKVTWAYRNSTNRPQEFGIAHVYNPRYGSRANNQLIINGRVETESTGYGDPFEPAIPSIVYWEDSPVAPYVRAAILTNGNDPEITAPDRLISVNADLIRFQDIWQTNPGGLIDGEEINSDPRTGVLLRYEPQPVLASATVAIASAVAYQVPTGLTDTERELLTVDNAFPRDVTRPLETFADDPLIAYPLPIGGTVLKGVNIITNTGTRALFGGNDTDGDGIPNDVDNCPNAPNPDQSDVNNDNVGDVCQGDRDSDGIDDVVDNCPDTANTDQADTDLDGEGDVCDDDIDNDGVKNKNTSVRDNCAFVVNPLQEDIDGDGIGDACEGDLDGDGVPDEEDNCIALPNPAQEDIDNDGLGDVCDSDRDGDGVENGTDICPDVFNTDQADVNGDGVGDACEDGIAIFSEQSTKRLPADQFNVQGITPGDFDGDGYLDFVLAVSGQGGRPESGSRNRIYLNEGSRGRPGYFYDATLGANGLQESAFGGSLTGGDDRFPFNSDETQSIIAFDFDLDGDLDLYFVNLADTTGTPGGQSRLYLNIDVDDSAINPFPDDNSRGDGFYVDISEVALPGVLNTKDGERPFFYAERPKESGSKATDFDGDGDPDILVTFRGRFAEDPTTGQIIQPFDTFGYADLDQGSIWSDRTIDTNDSTDTFEPNLTRATFGQRFLLNRRNELADAQGNKVPFGTPDPFLTFAQPAQFNDDIPADEAVRYERRLNKFWFSDETLGRDGVFGGASSSTDNQDRIPPGYLDIFQDAARSKGDGDTGNVEAMSFNAFDMVVGAFNGSAAPGFYVGHARSDLIGQGALFGLLDGSLDLMYTNVDIADENKIISALGLPTTGFISQADNIQDGAPAFFPGVDGVADGYFYLKNYGTDFWFGLPDQPTQAFIGAADGRPYDLNGPGTSDVDTQIPRQTMTYAVGAGDMVGSGYADAISASGATNFKFSAHPAFGIGRGQDGDGVGGFSQSLTLRETISANNSGGDQTFTVNTPLVTGQFRTRGLAVGDLDQNGAPDIAIIGDTAASENYNVLLPSAGGITLASNSAVTGAIGSFRTVGTLNNSNFPVFPGTAIALADVDNDGDLDIFAGTNGQSTRIFINGIYRPDISADLSSENDRPIFSDATRKVIADGFSTAFNIANFTNGASGSTESIDAGDIDRNGLIDVVVGGGATLTGIGDFSAVLLNRGPAFAGSQYLMPTAVGVPGPKLTTPSGSSTLNGNLDTTSMLRFVDIDGDGDLDIFQTNFGPASRLFLNKNANTTGGVGDTLYPDNPVLSGQTAKFYNSMADYEITDPRVAQTTAGGSGFPTGLGTLGTRDGLNYIGLTALGDGVYDRVDDVAVVPDLTAQGNGRSNTRNFRFGDIDNDGRLDIIFLNGVTNSGAQNVILMNRLANSTDPRSFRLVEDTAEPRLPEVTLPPPFTDLGTQFDDTYDAAFFDMDRDGDLDLVLGNSTEARSGDGSSRLVQETQVLRNDLTAEGYGFYTRVTNSNFIEFAKPVTRVLIGNFGRRGIFRGDQADGGATEGDIPEDQNGDGIVTDTERMTFDTIVKRLAAFEYAGSTVPIHFISPTTIANPEVMGYVAGVRDGFMQQVTEVIAAPTGANPNARAVTLRAQRFVNRDGDRSPGGLPYYDPIYDIIFFTATGEIVYYQNNGSGAFTDQTGTSFPQVIADPINDVDAADVNLDGWVDIALATSVARDEVSAKLLVNQRIAGTPVFFDRSRAEIPAARSTQFAGNFLSDPHGIAKAIRLFDVDLDGDPDMYVGENGRAAGATNLGALNAFYENRFIGAGFGPRLHLAVNLPVESGTRTIQRLAVNAVAPNRGVGGTTYDVRIFGSDFQGDAQVDFGQGVTVVQQPIVRSSQILDVRVRVETTANLGPRPVFIFNPDGRVAVNSAVTFTVGQPAKPNSGTSVADWTMFEQRN